MSDWLISMMPLSSFTSILGNEPVENTSPLIIKSFNGLVRHVILSFVFFYSFRMIKCVYCCRINILTTLYKT